MRGVARSLRDAWLIVGVTIVAMLVLEGVYRGQAAARRALRGDTSSVSSLSSPNHPNAREPWWHDVSAPGVNIVGTLQYDPFRGWWPSEHRSRHVNVDSQGRRVTLHMPTRSAQRPRRVYMFGGSSMWGWIVRDSFTVPSLVSSRLRASGYADIEVVNFAQPTFDLAQNAATLYQEIRLGRTPSVAVFLDGNNEIAPPFQSGVVGHTLNQAQIAMRFERKSDLGSDLMAVLRHSELVQRITQREPPPPDSGRLALCDDIAGSYARQVDAVAGLAAAFSVKPIFLWQPMLATSSKPLTRWERENSGVPLWRQMVARCTAAVDSALVPRLGSSFYSLRGLFDADTATVFTDAFGHVTERANQVIANRIATLVAQRLGALPHGPSTVTR